MNTIGLLKTSMDNKIEEQCEVHKEKTVFENLGFKSIKGTIQDSKTTMSKIKKGIYKITKNLLFIYDAFGIESLPLENWKQILNYRTAVDKKINSNAISADAKSIDSLYEILIKKKTHVEGDKQSEPFEIGTSSYQVTEETDDEETDDEKTDDEITKEAKPNTDEESKPSDEQTSPETEE